MSFTRKIGTSNILKSNVANFGKDIENQQPGIRKSKANGGNDTKKEFGSFGGNNKQILPTRGRAPLAPLVTFSSKRQNPDLAQRVTSVVNKNGASCEFDLPPKSSVSSIPPPRNTFQIFHDDNDQENIENRDVRVTTKTSDETKSSELVTVSSRQPLATLNVYECVNPEESQSPMVVDCATLGETDCEPQSVTTRSLWKQYSPELLVEDYADDIYNHLRDLEVSYSAKPTYMSKQPDVTCGMRSILVDWLVEVTEEYRLQKETLYLAVSYIDRFLSCMSVLRGKLQLVGTACMLIAAKYEEIYPPEVEEFVFITDDTYNQAQVLRMEQVILKVLKFDLAAPTSLCFLRRFSYLFDVDEVCYHLAMYLSELTLLEADPYLQFKPSIIAGAVLCVACHTLDMEPWSEQMTKSTGYTIDDFRPCINFVHKTFLNVEDYPQQAIREKYRSEKYSSVANIRAPLTAPF